MTHAAAISRLITFWKAPVWSRPENPLMRGAATAASQTTHVSVTPRSVRTRIALRVGRLPA